MSKIFDKNYKGIFSKQNRFLPVIFCFLPLIIINFGWYFLTYIIDNRWKQVERKEQAKQEVEQLSVTSDFSYCFGKLGGDFYQQLKSGSEIYSNETNKDTIKKYLENQDKKIFGKPFTNYELFVFNISNKTKKTQIIYTNQNSIIGKRALELIFEYFVKINSKDKSYSEIDKKKAADFAKNVLGGECNPAIIAETQRGKASFSLYKFKTNRFYWDYYKNDKTEDTVGFFLIADNNIEAEISSKLIALRDFHGNQNNKNKKYGAFIPLFPGYGGIIVDEEFSKLPEYQLMIKKWVPRDIDGLYKWNKNGFPSDNEDTHIGNYQAFFHISQGQSHCAVLLLPKEKTIEFPRWLLFINTIISFFIALLLLRGFTLGIWPITSLRARFFITYFLASSIPLGLLIIVTIGYISEYKHSTLSKYQSQLKLSINQFDSRQTKSQENYRAALLNLKNDKAISKAFKNLDLANKKRAQKFLPEAEEVLSRSIKHFYKEQKDKNLPILSMTILDERGDCFTCLGNNELMYYRHSENEENIYIENNKDRNTTNIEAINNSLIEKTIDTILYSILQPLRKRISTLDPENVKWKEELTPSFEQRIAVGGFNAAVGNSAGTLSEEFDRRKGVIVTRKNGDKLISYLYDYILVDNVPRFAIFIYWDVSSLDQLTIKSTIDYLALQEPNHTFSVIKVTPQGLENWDPNNRHWSDNKTTNDIVSQAYLTKTAITKSDENKTIIAVPSKKYSDTIIIGSISHHHMQLPIYYRYLVCIAIIAISIMIFIVCLSISLRLFLNPIDNVKKSLDRIALGEFDIEIKSGRKDEFGTICQEFTNMAHELSERNKLATLISDHAIEALSRKEESNDLANVESFIGATLVSDIRNFTGMCEHYPPDQITNLLNEHFAVMTKIVSENGGRIYKYIGDAIEVVFANQDDSQKTSVERAFQTSIEMIESLAELNKKRLEKGLFEYRIGIGLGYGEMLSGSIGSLETRLDYAIIGKALENARKTENLSKLNQKLPIVFAKEFVDELKKHYSKIEFTPLTPKDNDINNYIIDNNNLDAYLEEKGKKSFKPQISDVLNIADKQKGTTDKTNKIIETEKKFSNAFYYSNGLVFLILLTIVVFGGLYFSYSFNLNNKKVALSYDNQRVLEQISCEDYARVAFDIKCREIAKKLNNKINELKEDDILDEQIAQVLNDSFKSDKILSSINFNKLFVRVKNLKESINLEDEAFCDKISIVPIANTGFTEQEQKDIYNTYRICVTLNTLDEITSKLKNKTNAENSFQQKCREHMEGNYGEPSRQVFGENALIALLKHDWLNTSVEVTRRINYNQRENHYLYTLDFYKSNKKETDSKPELIGFLIISLSKAQAQNSIQLILNAYSQDGEMIAMKNTDSNQWSFSDNISDEIRNNIINKNIIQDYMVNEADKNIVDNYFKSLSDVNVKEHINICGNNYDIYMFRQYKRIDKITLSVFIIICLVFIYIYHYFIRIIKGNSIINYSVSAKLWLNLVVVAIIPLLTMFFVFNLFINEYFSVQISQKKNEMQRFNDIFELKPSFSSPIAWTLSKKKSNSEELHKYIKALNKENQTEDYYKNYLNELRTLTGKWFDESKAYSQKEKDIISFFMADMSISGKKGWSFCFTDEEDSYTEQDLNVAKMTQGNTDETMASVSYIESNIDNSRKGFGIMLKLFAKALLNSRGEGMSLTNGKIDKSIVFNDLALDTALKTVKTFFGDDKFVEFSHGINIPILLDIGVGNLGIMIIPIPDYKKPEAILVWMFMFNSYTYLNEQTSKINTDFKVYSAEGFRYGIIAKETFDNELRIPIGKYAAWVSTSNLPISTNINIKNEQYLMEGISAKLNYNSLMFYLYPETIIMKDRNKMYIVFYAILIILIKLIIDTTKNIANDIINPITALITGIKEVNRENFAFRVNTDRTDELGALCLSFDKMVKGLDEKRTMSHMLSKSAQLFTLKGNGANSIKVDSVLLYVGIPNFNVHTQKFSNEKIFDSLKNQTSIISGIIMKAGGEVDKIIGEKLLAVFPVNKNANDSLITAYKVAQKIQDEEKANNLPLPVAIGLNYGNVISGFLGVGNKRDFTIIGDPVNVTARIENLAEQLEKDRCLISATFYEQTKDQINAKLYGEVELKGKSQPMKVYQLT